MPLYAGLKKRCLREFTKGILLSYFICTFVYTTIGCVGYLTFGEDIPSDLLTAYSQLDGSLIVGYAIMAIKAITSYPAVFFCARYGIELKPDYLILQVLLHK